MFLFPVQFFHLFVLTAVSCTFENEYGIFMQDLYFLQKLYLIVNIEIVFPALNSVKQISSKFVRA